MTLERKRGGWETRLRYGKGKRDRFLIAVDTDTEPVERELSLRQVADSLACAEARPDVARETLAELAALTDESDFTRGVRGALKECERRIAEIGRARPARSRLDTKTTFGDVAELFLAKQLGQGNSPRSIARDRTRLEVLAPKLARVPVEQVTHRLAVEAMALVPTRAQTNRRLYEGLVSRVLKHAARLELIESVPLKAGFVSAQSAPTQLFQYLRTGEEARLVACPEVPLWRRLGYAIMGREGVRPEFLQLFHWGDRASPEIECSIDLESGLLSHRHKTRRPRRWTICERVLRVLRAWRRLGLDSARVLPEWHSKYIAQALRADLLTAGVTRPALHRTTSTERQITAKDAGRATFITLAKRAGAPREWIRERSGHMTDEMEERYNRMAREVRDTERAWLRPLDELLGAELGLEPLDTPYVVPWLQGLGGAELGQGTTPPVNVSDLGRQLAQLSAMLSNSGLISAVHRNTGDISSR